MKKIDMDDAITYKPGNGGYSMPQLEDILHDMKTPMSIMYAYLNELERAFNSGDCCTGEECIKMIDVIKKYWFRIMKMISDAMDFDRLNNGLITPALNNLDMVYIVRELVNSTRALSARKNITITFSTDIDVCVMAADKFIIERILLNLLSNSVKFTGECGKIEVHVSSEGKKFGITVKDNGIGIESDKLNRIFDKHYTEISELNKSGSGLGLYIVKHLVTLLEGEIFVSSQNGTEITVRIPIRIIDEVQPDNKKYTNFYNDNIVQIELADAY